MCFVSFERLRGALLRVLTITSKQKRTKQIENENEYVPLHKNYEYCCNCLGSAAISVCFQPALNLILCCLYFNRYSVLKTETRCKQILCIFTALLSIGFNPTVIHKCNLFSHTRTSRIPLVFIIREQTNKSR